MQLNQLIVSGAALFTLNLAMAQVPELPAGAGAKSQVLQDYGKLPLQFEANAGQVDSRVLFLSRGGGHTLFLTRDEAVLGTLRMRFEGRSARTSLRGAIRPNGTPTSPRIPRFATASSIRGSICCSMGTNAIWSTIL